MPVQEKFKFCSLELAGISFFLNIFNPWLVDSTDVEPTDREGQLCALWILINPFNYQSMQNWKCKLCFLGGSFSLRSVRLLLAKMLSMFHACVVNGSVKDMGRKNLITLFVIFFLPEFTYSHSFLASVFWFTRPFSIMSPLPSAPFALGLRLKVSKNGNSTFLDQYNPL